MSPNVDFTKLLDGNIEDTERPKPCPAGTFVATIKGHEFGESSKKKTPYVRYNVSPLAPQDDVDADALTEFGGTEALAAKSFGLDYYLTPDAMWRLAELLEEHLGLSCSGRNYSEVIPEADGQQILITVEHSISQKDGVTIYANIGTVAKAE